VSQEQLKNVEQQVPNTDENESVSPDQEQSITTSTTPQVEQSGVAAASTAPGKKRGKKKTPPVDVNAISPRPSYWPLVLAFSVSVLLLGLVTHPIILGVGVVLVIGTLIGWFTERR
jgi:Cytochrome c oxidase subunit IV